MTIRIGPQLVGVVLWLLSLTAQAGMPYTDAEVLRAFEEVAMKGVAASARSQTLAFKYNDRLNMLRLENRISDRIFQANQDNFKRINDNLIGRAAAQNNMTYTPQKPLPGKLPTPMSDTDAILNPVAGGKPLTAAQVNKAAADYQRMTQELLAKHGVSAPGAAMPDTNTSLMPDPRNMTRAEWETWNAQALKRGEVIYKNPVAADAEAKMRAGEGLNAYEAASRVREMQRLATEHFQAADKLEAASRQASASANHAAARKLQLQAQTMRHNAAKYITRIHDTGQYMSGKAGLTPTGQPPPDALKQAAVRGSQTATQAKAVAQQSQQLLDQANQSFLDNMSHVATRSKDPVLVNQAKRNMARLLNELPEVKRAQALETIARKNGRPLAREMERTMRMLPKGKPATVVKPPPSKLETAVKTFSTAMVIYQGVTRMGAVRDAKDFAEQFVELSAAQQTEILQQLTPEQRDYLDQAIARIDDPVYQEKMRQAGFIPPWHTAAQSEEAGRQLGGFTGGYVGGKIGVLAGMKIGAATGTFIGGPVGTVIGGGVGFIVGVTGYVVGNYVGTSLGDTRSGWWDHNLPDDEFNRRAVAAGGMTPQAIYDRLVARGLNPEIAREVANNYRDGSLDAFAGQVRIVREHFEEMERLEAERRQREEDNRRRAEDHRIAQEFFEDAWARTEQQEREYDRRVEQSYQDWMDEMIHRSPQERQQAYDEAGLTSEQRKELEERIAALPPSAQPQPSAPKPDTVKPSAPPTRSVTYGQTITLELGAGIRDGESRSVDTDDKNLARWQMRGNLATESEKQAFDEGYRHGYDAASLRQYWETAPPPEPGSDAYTWDRWEARRREIMGGLANDRQRKAYLMGYHLSLDGKTEDVSTRFLFHATPTLDFDPPESIDGRTSVTFDRIGSVQIWAQVEQVEDGATRHSETPTHTFEVKSPSFTMTFTPAAALPGREVRARITAQPAVPDNLITYVWSSPPSSARQHHAANASIIAVIPQDADPISFRAEARAPVHGDVLGVVTGTFQAAADEEEQDPLEEAQALIQEGYALEQRQELAEAVSKYQEAQQYVFNDGVARRIVELQNRIDQQQDSQQRAQALVQEGYALEQQNELTAALTKYQEAQQYHSNDGVARRIVELQNRIEQQREEKRHQAELARHEEEQRRQAEAQRQAEEQRKQAEEQQRQAEARRHTEARQQAETRRQSEEATRQREQQQAQQNPLSGTYTMSGRVLLGETSYGGQQFRSWLSAWQLTLRQDGTRVTGSSNMTIEWASGERESDRSSVSGTVRGNRLHLNTGEGIQVFTISPDFRTLTLREDGVTITLRR